MGINHKSERARNVRERIRKGINVMTIYSSFIDVLAVWNGIKGVGNNKGEAAKGTNISTCSLPDLLNRRKRRRTDRQSDDGICVWALLWEGG